MATASFPPTKSRTFKLNIRKNIKDILFLSVGIVMAAIGLKGFLLPNGFLDGGAVGASLLLQKITHLDLSILIILVNAPFLLLGARQISLQFAIKSLVAIIVLAALVHVIEVPPVTEDKLLIAVFGGFFLGAGIGLAIRGGGVIDGSEVLALTVSRKTSLTVGDFIALFNIVLFLLSILLVGVEVAMYSLLTYFAAGRTVDFIINGIEEYIGVMVVSNESEAVKKMISEDLGRGVTVFKAESGYTPNGKIPEDKKVLFLAVTRMEVTKVIHEIEKIDGRAFVVQYPIKDTRGGMIRKRPLH